MSLLEIGGLSLIEIVGDTAVKMFANNGGIVNLGVGIIGYLGVFILLIISLQNSSILMVNGAWDGMSGILESIFAFVVLGERFDHLTQYLGLGIIIIGMYLLRIPIKKDIPFKIPKL